MVMVYRILQLTSASTRRRALVTESTLMAIAGRRVAPAMPLTKPASKAVRVAEPATSTSAGSEAVTAVVIVTAMHDLSLQVWLLVALSATTQAFPPAAAVVTLYVACCVPPPHFLEQVPDALHAPAQSTQAVTVQAWLLVAAAQAVPPLAAAVLTA